MQFSIQQNHLEKLGALAVACVTLSGVAMAHASGAATVPESTPVMQHYTQTDLTSNNASLAPMHDQNLVNPWGLSRSSDGPWWVSDNGTGFSTLYDGAGVTQPLVVTIPAAEAGHTGSPTGTIFNGGTGFAIKGRPSIFLFVTEDGTISGWNPQGNLTNALIAVNEKNHSVYKGATIAAAGRGEARQQYLYVADFFHARVQIFDRSFHHVAVLEDRFAQRADDTDHQARVEDSAAGHQENGEEGRKGEDGFAPFNVQNIGGNIYVAYAKQDASRFNEVDGAGLGFVVIYSPEGRRLGQLQKGAYFNAPWGMTLASSDFGAYSHDLLVGQFGSGEILVFDPLTGKFMGSLTGANNAPLKIDGLWGLSFGNGLKGGPATSLYFAAGVNHEQGGLLGSIAPVENEQGNNQ